jgi:hypothetical protein
MLLGNFKGKFMLKSYAMFVLRKCFLSITKHKKLNLQKFNQPINRIIKNQKQTVKSCIIKNSILCDIKS